MKSKFVADAKRRAEEAFSSGWYCAESVVLALAEAQNVEGTLLPKAATAFCSGMSRTCGPCGALTGAVMGISLGLGRLTPEEPVDKAYLAVQRLVKEFELEFGARNCEELLGCNIGTPEGQAKFKENDLGKRCANYTSKATEMAIRILSENSN